MASLKPSADPYPDWTCYDCGIEHGCMEPVCATWHVDTCDVCGKTNVPCTEPRDFGHFLKWRED